MSHFLVVDDSAADARLVGGLLERYTRYHAEYASNGLQALETMEAKLPLVVITDLQMPEMDGMQLVEAVRRQYPTVPVIVMTAYGSEEIALRALMMGAADYIPKSRLSAQLFKSVEGLLAITVDDRPRQRLSHCLRYQELEYELENDLRLIPPLVEHLQRTAGDLALVDQTDGVRLGKALVETLHNAICHGNLELSQQQLEAAAEPLPPGDDPIALRREQIPYRNRRVHVRAVFSPREARFTIRDEGPGFDTAKLPDVKSDPSYLTGGGGHGLVLVRMFMDEVVFSPAGNEILLVKRAHPGPTASRG